MIRVASSSLQQPLLPQSGRGIKGANLRSLIGRAVLESKRYCARKLVLPAYNSIILHSAPHPDVVALRRPSRLLVGTLELPLGALCSPFHATGCHARRQHGTVQARLCLRGPAGSWRAIDHCCGTEAVVPSSYEARTLQRGSIAPELHHFRPLITYVSPSVRMSHAMFVASELATAGSVIRKALRTVPDTGERAKTGGGVAFRASQQTELIMRKHTISKRVCRRADRQPTCTGACHAEQGVVA